MKRFEYLSLGKQLKAQTDVAMKQYQKLDDTDEFGETKNKKSTIKNYSKSDLIMTLTIVFSNIVVIKKKNYKLSFKPKYSF